MKETEMGFIGVMMNVKLLKVKKAMVFEDNKAKIRHLMENPCVMWSIIATGRLRE